LINANDVYVILLEKAVLLYPKNIYEALSILSGILFVFAFIPYTLSILKGPTRPSKASWIIWASIDYIIFFGMLAKGTVNGQIVGAIIGATVVIRLALKYGEPGWSLLDKYCLFGAGIGIVFWIIFQEANFGIIACCLVALMGTAPTAKTVWGDPGSENKLAWTIFWVSCVCAVIARFLLDR
jgi:hypothetical protein